MRIKVKISYSLKKSYMYNNFNWHRKKINIEKQMKKSKRKKK